MRLIMTELARFDFLSALFLKKFSKFLTARHIPYFVTPRNVIFLQEHLVRASLFLIKFITVKRINKVK